MYLMQETTHQGPVIDLKYNLHFHRIVSIRCGSAQVWNFNTDGKPTPNYIIVCPFHILFQRESKHNEPTINYIQFNGDQYQYLGRWCKPSCLHTWISYSVSAFLLLPALKSWPCLTTVNVLTLNLGCWSGPSRYKFTCKPLIQWPSYIHAYQCTALILIGKIIISP